MNVESIKTTTIFHYKKMPVVFDMKYSAYSLLVWHCLALFSYCTVCPSNLLLLLPQFVPYPGSLSTLLKKDLERYIIHFQAYAIPIVSVFLQASPGSLCRPPGKHCSSSDARWPTRTSRRSSAPSRYRY